MPEPRKIIAGSGTFHEKVYAYDRLARSVAEVRSALPADVTLDFVLLSGTPPEKKAENRAAIDDAFRKAGTTVEVVDMDDLPGTENHWQWNSRRIIWHKESYFAGRALRHYTDFLSWEVDVFVDGPRFGERASLWLDHAERGHVLCSILPYNEKDAPDGKAYMAYNFIDAQLKVDEPVMIASFVTRESDTKRGVRTSSKRFKFKKKDSIDDLVLCEQRKQCVTWINGHCQGSNHSCAMYAQPTKTNVFQEAVWAIANPRLKAGATGDKTEDYVLPQLHTRPIRDLFERPRDKDGLLKAHGGHLGFTLVPAHLFRRMALRYKPWVKQHPDTWFFFDCAKKGVPVYLDPSIVVEHDHREWSKDVAW